VEHDQSVHALDCISTDSYLATLACAQANPNIGAITARAFLGCPESIPANLYATTSAGDDVLAQMLTDPHFYLLGRRYLDFARVYLPKKAHGFVIMPILQRRQSWQRDRQPLRHPISRPSNPTIQLTAPHTAREHPDPPRRIRYSDAGECPPQIFPVKNNPIPGLTNAGRDPSPWPPKSVR
jgi:hypothetical protein